MPVGVVEIVDQDRERSLRTGLAQRRCYEVARSIRKSSAAWSHPVRLIALTGYGQSSDREAAAQAGFDVHLLKPVDPASLRAELLA